MNSLNCGRELMFERANVAMFARYLMVTAFSASVMLGMPYLLHEGFSIQQRWAVAIAFVIAFISNFVIARVYVFRSRADWRKQFGRFVLASASMRIAEYLSFLAIHMWTDLNYVVIVLLVLVVSFGLKFMIFRTFVFGSAANGAR